MCEILFLDTETTGLDPIIDEILQCAIIDDKDYQFNSLYKPRYLSQWSDSEQIHHITPDKVAHCNNFTQTDNIAFIQKLLDDSKILVGYNIASDLLFLKAAGLSFHNLHINDIVYDFADFYGPQFPEISWYDIKKHWRNQKLITAANYFGYNFVPHDALEDARATRFVWNKLQSIGIKPKNYTIDTLVAEKEARESGTQAVTMLG